MDYLKEYKETNSWYRKCVMMNMFHMSQKLKGKWSVTDTARHFNVSIGLVSENLKLAKALDTNPLLPQAKTRHDALYALEHRNGKPIKWDEDEY